ncbi:Uncharacterized protein APZ42_028965 [Daphnia magna]|uniref:Uncharacterized protein n=1 Tax=Daphnia magna TaxID=35525 RepID=A0A164Q162_9CRUS|nr:Uncharacterized protein APZ42_028965 [Daphnia magna]
MRTYLDLFQDVDDKPAVDVTHPNSLTVEGDLQFLDIPAAELQQDIEKNNLNSENPLKDREGREFEAVPTSFVYYGYQLLMFGFFIKTIVNA